MITTIGYNDWYHNYRHCLSECVFNKNEWFPGLKKGREWSEEDVEEFNEGLEGFPEVHI